MIAAATDEWRVMITVALRTGLRLGELMALRWRDVDLVAGRLVVRQTIVRGIVRMSKSGKPREVPLSDEALKALAGHRHLRGPLVFCDWDGRTLRVPKVRYAIERACKKAGIGRSGGTCCVTRSRATSRCAARRARRSICRLTSRAKRRGCSIGATAWQQNAKIAATH